MQTMLEALKLGIRHLLNNFDRDQQMLPWFDLRLRYRERAYLDHLNPLDLAHVPGRMIDALLYAEAVTGFPIPEDMLSHVRKLLFDSFETGPCLNKAPDGQGNWRIDFHNFREALLSLTALYQYRNDDEALSLARRMIARLADWTDEEGEWRRERFAEGFLYGIDDCPTVARGRLAGALVKFYEVTGDEQARGLAKVYVDYTLKHAFTPEGGLTERAGTHIHSITSTVHAVAQLGACLADRELLRAAERIMNGGLAPFTAYHGWVKELIGPPEMVGEVNCAADLIQTALLLGDSGQHAYYSVAERMLRGFLLPSQIRSPRDIHPDWLICDTHPGADRYADIEERVIGGFGFPSPTDRVQLHYEHPYARVTTLDITAGAMQAICECQRRALTEKAGEWRLNLLMDRPQGPIRWMRVGEDRYVLRCDDGRKVSIRIPQGISTDEIAVSINGIPETPDIRTGYLRLKCAADAAFSATIHFPSGSVQRSEFVMGYKYTVCMRAEETLSIHPRGGIAPLY